jgi:hypothetical protein
MTFALGVRASEDSVSHGVFSSRTKGSLRIWRREIRPFISIVLRFDPLTDAVICVIILL